MENKPKGSTEKSTTLKEMIARSSTKSLDDGINKLYTSFSNYVNELEKKKLLYGKKLTQFEIILASLEFMNICKDDFTNSCGIILNVDLKKHISLEITKKYVKANDKTLNLTDDEILEFIESAIDVSKKIWILDESSTKRIIPRKVSTISKKFSNKNRK